MEVIEITVPEHCASGSHRSSRSLRHMERKGSSGGGSSYDRKSSMDQPSYTLQVIHDLNLAVTRAHRMNAIDRALQAFHHNKEHIHDQEIEFGAANALCLKLGYSLMSHSGGGGGDYGGHNHHHHHHHGHHHHHHHEQEHPWQHEHEQLEEVTMILSALSMTYKCSASRRSKSFQEIGSELLPMLIQVMELRDQKLSEMAKVHCVAILRSLAKLEQVKHVLIGFEHGVVLETLIARVLLPPGTTVQNYYDPKTGTTDCDHHHDDHSGGGDTSNGGSITSKDISHDSEKRQSSSLPPPPPPPPPPPQQSTKMHASWTEGLGVVKDLSFRCQELDKITMYNTKGMLQALLTAATVPREGGRAAKAREFVSGILWNFAIEAPIAEQMVQSTDIIDALLLLLEDRNNVKTRRNAASTLGNFTMAAPNRRALLMQSSTNSNSSISSRCSKSSRSSHGSHDDEKQKRKKKHVPVVHTLMLAVKNDEDTDTRRRAMRTLRCLASGQAARVVEESQLFLAFLYDVIGKEKDSDTKLQACEALGVIAADPEAIKLCGTELLGETIVRVCNNQTIAAAAAAGSGGGATSNDGTEDSRCVEVGSAALVDYMNCVGVKQALLSSGPDNENGKDRHRHHSEKRLSMSSSSSLLTIEELFKAMTIVVKSSSLIAKRKVARLLSELSQEEERNERQQQQRHPEGVQQQDDENDYNKINNGNGGGGDYYYSGGSSSSVLTKPAALDTLASLLSPDATVCIEARTKAVQTVVKMAKKESNRAPMAAHEELLTSLVNFALSCQDGDMKDGAKVTIMTLVAAL